MTYDAARGTAAVRFEVINQEIDWFDLRAIVHWGEQQVPLAEIRKALRRDERFIKLADSTIGEIPADWLEKYRHLFGLSEAQEDGLRVARLRTSVLATRAKRRKKRSISMDYGTPRE